MRTRTIETRRDRAVLARDAGIGKVSFLSVLAGTLVAYGAVAVLAAVAAAIARGVGVDTNLSTGEWRDLGIAGGAITAVVLLVSYYFGGYVAGRMARRAGATNGLLVFVLGVLLLVGVAGLVSQFTDVGEIRRNLRSVGMPVTADEWGQVGTFAGIASLAAMVVGAVLGGMAGERWHGKLVTRAFDPEVGAGVPAAMATAGDTVGGRGRVVDDGTSVISRREDDNRTDDHRAEDHRDGDTHRDERRDTTVDEDRSARSRTDA